MTARITIELPKNASMRRVDIALAHMALALGCTIRRDANITGVTHYALAPKYVPAMAADEERE